MDWIPPQSHDPNPNDPAGMAEVGHLMQQDGLTFDEVPAPMMVLRSERWRVYHWGLQLGTFPKNRLIFGPQVYKLRLFFGFSENFAKSHEHVAADTLPKSIETC